MEEAIRSFAEQFSYDPVIENRKRLQKKRITIVAGMGGSHLAADLLNVWKPQLSMRIHSDYGLPAIPEEELKECLVIASSYSGNTEEALDAFEEAQKKHIPCAAVSTGGKLLERAKENNLPFVQMPATGIQPRAALGYSLRALMALMNLREGLEQTQSLAESLDPDAFEEKGKTLAETVKGKVPIIYASNRNAPIAYNWKIKLNETGKIPAFWNMFPELNHNEMMGFAVQQSTQTLTEKFSFLFLSDETDHPRIRKRMDVLEDLLNERAFLVQRLPLTGSSTFEKIFSSLLLADWTALYTARSLGLDPEAVPFIEEFKKRIA